MLPFPENPTPALGLRSFALAPPPVNNPGHVLALRDDDDSEGEGEGR